MKNVNLSFYQNETEYKMSFEIANDKVKADKLSSIALNELFTTVENYKAANVLLFKSSEPILFRVTVENENLLDIGKVNKAIQSKMKFNKTNKSKRSFAKRVKLALFELSRTVDCSVDYNVLEQKLKD